jgi:hypothetical protein
MAIEYRSVDVDATTKEANRNNAIEHEMRAFGAEIEVERLDAVLKNVKTSDDHDAVTELLETAKEDVKAHRARANEVKSAADLSADHRRL